MASTAFTHPQAQPQGARSFLGKLNGPWHKRALQTFMIIVIAHWAEHLVQAYQVYVLKWPVHEARGVTHASGLRMSRRCHRCVADRKPR